MKLKLYGAEAGGSRTLCGYLKTSVGSYTALSAWSRGYALPQTSDGYCKADSDGSM